MLFYNFKLFIFSIILGTLTLIYNNHCYGLYKNIIYKNSVLVPKKFRSLGELLHEPTTNHKLEKTKLREYKNNNETKYKKSQYPNKEAERKQKITEVTEKENIGTINLKKYKNETYDKEKEAKSNKPSRSIKYLEMQRKLYNNFYATPEKNFEIFSEKSNAKIDKTCECPNKKNSSNKLYSSNKIHDNYLDNLKSGCVGGASTCAISSVATGYTAAVAAAVLKATAGTGTVAGTKFTVASIAPIVLGIATLVLILIAVVLIILYIWLRKRQNSWKHECKKHLFT